MSKLYRATSLDDIAKQFRENANKAQDQMNRETNSRQRDHLAGTVVTWHSAATMLEQTEIVPGPDTLDKVLGPTENVGSTTK